MPPLRRIQFSPLNSFRTALRIGVMATAATFSGDTDLDAAETKSVSGLRLNLVKVQPGSFNPGKPDEVGVQADEKTPPAADPISKLPTK